MASSTVASCAIYNGPLCSTFESQACLGNRSYGIRPESVSLPSSRIGILGSSPVQLEARCSPCIEKHEGCGRRQFSRMTCIAASEEMTLEEEIIPKEEANPLTPFTFEVHQLLMELCDETSVAELQLKVGSFKLNVRRDVGRIRGVTVAPPVASPPVPSKFMGDSLSSAPVRASPKPKASTTSGLISSLSKPLSSTWALLESAADEGLLFVKSPKGQVIKEGHVVCYLEQLGTQQPVESNISGEVVKVLWDDGEPVGYGDPLIAIRPSFPGIKKLT